MTAPDKPYPIHPLLDELIQTFKSFSAVEFPRGMPVGQQDIWLPTIRCVTRFEASVIGQASEYLCGRQIDLSQIKYHQESKTALQAQKAFSDAEHLFLVKLKQYQETTEKILFLMEDCVRELGNPCQSYKAGAVLAE